jgi:hypothetical protein
MKTWISLLFAAASLAAAVVRGTVVTYDGGEPLSQTAVTLRAVAGAGSSTVNTKTDHFGNFEFSGVTAGAYLLTASRPYFVPALYGQKRWNSAGLPLVVEDNSTPTLSVRMHRYGGIAGRVVDENDVGILGHEVVAYRNELPLEVVAKAITDDYGRYRIAGLAPGNYLVRSAAKRVEGVDYLPTFAPAAKEMSQARSVDVTIDIDSSGVDVHPAQGRLFDIAGQISLDRRSDFCGPLKLTLAGDTGRQTLEADRSFQFNPVAPGQYELYGEGPCLIPPSSQLCPLVDAYLKLPVEEDRKTLTVVPTCVRGTGFSYAFEGGSQATLKTQLALQARRKDLAGVAGAIQLGNAPRTALLAAGRWEVWLQPPPEDAVVGYYDSWTRSQDRPDAWHEILAGDSAPGTATLFGFKQYLLSNSPGSLSGVVIGLSHENVIGAPVYLEGYDPDLKKRVTSLRTAFTDTRGAYRFGGLTPGEYRVLATFEYQSPDAATMDASGAMLLTIEKGKARTQDLDLFVQP